MASLALMAFLALRAYLVSMAERVWVASLALEVPLALGVLLALRVLPALGEERRAPDAKVVALEIRVSEVIPLLPHLRAFCNRCTFVKEEDGPF